MVGMLAQLGCACHRFGVLSAAHAANQHPLFYCQQPLARIKEPNVPVGWQLTPARTRSECLCL